MRRKCGMLNSLVGPGVCGGDAEVGMGLVSGWRAGVRVYRYGCVVEVVGGGWGGGGGCKGEVYMGG